VFNLGVRVLAREFHLRWPSDSSLSHSAFKLDLEELIDKDREYVSRKKEKDDQTDSEEDINIENT